MGNNSCNVLTMPIRNEYCASLSRIGKACGRLPTGKKGVGHDRRGLVAVRVPQDVDDLLARDRRASHDEVEDAQFVGGRNHPEEVAPRWLPKILFRDLPAHHLWERPTDCAPRSGWLWVRQHLCPRLLRFKGRQRLGRWLRSRERLRLGREREHLGRPRRLCCVRAPSHLPVPLAAIHWRHGGPSAEGRPFKQLAQEMAA